MIFAAFAAAALTSCAPAEIFSSEADERLYKSIELGGDFDEIAESVAAGANIDKLKRGRLISVNMVEFAAVNGRTDIAEWLINNGADVNYKTSIMGETLLMDMAAAGEYDLCALLLEKGADISAKDRLSDTALEYAFKAAGDISEAEIDKLVTFLLENGAEIRSETLSAALSGYTGKGDGDCRYGLVRRIALGLTEKGGGTSLRPAIWAAITGDGDTAAQLISAGGVGVADQNLILYYTAAFGTADTLKSLEDKGLDMQSSDKDGNTLLMLAARFGNTETIRYLLDGTKDFYKRNRFGKTALDEAADSGNSASVLLLEANMPSNETAAFNSICDCSCCGCH